MFGYFSVQPFQTIRIEFLEIVYSLVALICLRLEMQQTGIFGINGASEPLGHTHICESLFAGR